MSRQIHYFVSYAHDDKAEANQLLSLLQTRLKIAKGFEFSHWIDDQIELGGLWREQIQTAIEKSDFGLLLLSPNFFASEFIVNEELNRFISALDESAAINKAIVPVGLKAVPMNGSADLKGLQHIQIFRDGEDRWFNQLRGHNKDAFADQLTANILTKLKAAP